MKNWFNNKKAETTIEVKGVNPQTENEFMFFEFVANEEAYRLDSWYKKAKELGYSFKNQYETAIVEKIKTGKFDNPHNFRDYFGLNFDFIAIDFETANEQRISACALGIAFVQNNSIVHTEHFFIKPPQGQTFNQRNIDIHGITPSQVQNAQSFEYIWNNVLAEYFNKNLIVFHNASMDLSILRQLFDFYRISDFSIKYSDTMNLASYLGMPKKLIELADLFKLKVVEHHNPVEDAVLCAQVFSCLSEQKFDFTKLIYTLTDNQYAEKEQLMNAFLHTEQTYEKCDKLVEKYLLPTTELGSIELKDKAFIFTGDLKISRDLAQKAIIELGGIIKNGISSKIDYVIIGQGYGWSKIEKVDSLNSEKGLNIRIIDEIGFNEIIKNAL